MEAKGGGDPRRRRPTIDTQPHGGDLPDTLHSPIPDAQSMMLTASSIFIFPQLDEQKEEQWKVRDTGLAQLLERRVSGRRRKGGGTETDSIPTPVPVPS
jgi:hypothetical protein